ncbi:MAG: UDP-N-acetylmuramoyl-tripeptide--D-alanyl-D-alanine ligase [Clostridiales Family XIII bacterium]|nr:UDP-N-acetylmuramoyl-tripeptide--D-alanyl-D-alanine ligase [Clostridiales Family XIII bacterium]
MKELSVGETIRAVGGRLLRGEEADTYRGVSSDSRTVFPRDLFVALAGARFDAHDFLSQAVARGCRSLMVSRFDAAPADFDGNVIGVADTLIAYQDLAAYYRALIAPRTIGVTGSVGKTSLKDMIASVCETRRRTVRSEKNFNNHIGVPRTILAMDADTEVLVLEMGMNHAGEIRRLVEIGRPDIAVISNVGLSHRENFDDEDGVFEAKAEIATFFDEHSVLVVNGDDPRLGRFADMPGRNYRLVTAGEDATCDFRVSDAKYINETEIAFEMIHGEHTRRFVLPAAGLYNAVNAGLAAAVVHELGIGMDRVAETLRVARRAPHRLQLLERAGIKVIDDVYNAGPASMRSALEYLAVVRGARKIAVLAGMNELGGDSPLLHRAVGAFAVKSGADLLITVGGKAEDIAVGAADAGMPTERRAHFADNASASDFLAGQTRPGDVYLVKGSRAMRMEEVVDALKSLRAPGGRGTT